MFTCVFSCRIDCNGGGGDPFKNDAGVLESVEGCTEKDGKE